MVHLRVLIAAVVKLKWDLAINHVHFGPLMQRAAFSLPVIPTRAVLLYLQSVPVPTLPH